MTKRQKYSNGGGPKKVKDIFKLDLSGNKKQGINSEVTIKTKNASISANQKDGRNFNTTLDLKLPKQKASVTVSRSKGGNFSGKVTKDTSNFLGKNSTVSFSADRPKGGGGGRYGITYSKLF